MVEKLGFGNGFLLFEAQVFDSDKIFGGFIGADDDGKRDAFLVGIFELFVEFGLWVKINFNGDIVLATERVDFKRFFQENRGKDGD